jgi:hypothetical protein
MCVTIFLLCVPRPKQGGVNSNIASSTIDAVSLIGVRGGFTGKSAVHSPLSEDYRPIRELIPPDQ